MQPKLWCVLTIKEKRVSFWAFHTERAKAIALAEKFMAEKNFQSPIFCMDIFSNEKDMQLKRYTNWMLRHGIPQCDVASVIHTTMQGLRESINRARQAKPNSGGKQ